MKIPFEVLDQVRDKSVEMLSDFLCFLRDSNFDIWYDSFDYFSLMYVNDYYIQGKKYKE